MKLFTKCPTRRELARFLDSDVTFRREQKISAHVDGCSTCQKLLEELTTQTELPAFFNGVDVVGQRKSSLMNLIGKLREDTWPTSISETAQQNPAHAAPNQLDAAIRHDGFSGQTIGQYQLLDIVGRGGSGVVYRAYDQKLERVVAIKMMRADYCNQNGILRMEREAKNIAAISHENILGVFAFETPGPECPSPAPYLVTEFVRGQSLERRISETGALEPRQTAKLIRDVANGLAAAHNQSIVHRDIKSSNILLSEKGRPKIADFGLAIDEAFASRITATGIVAGTLAYMSPEQINDPDDVDRRADIYGLGVVLYECLTGELPFRGVARATIERIIHERPRDPVLLNANVPRDLNSICLKAISKAKGRRYQTAEEFSADLTRWLNGEQTIARPISRTEKTIGWAAKNRLVTALLLLTVLLTGAFIAGLVNSNRLKSELLVQKTQQAKSLESERDHLLSTVGDVVYDISDYLEENDWNTISPDDIQQRALEISIDGLAKASGLEAVTSSNTANNPGLSVGKNATVKALAAEFQLRLGVVSYRQDKLDESLALLEQTISLSTELLSNSSGRNLKAADRERIANVKTRGEIWTTIARFNIGEVDEALESLEQMFQDCKRSVRFTNADLEWIGDLGTVGVEIARMVEADRAENYFHESLGLAQTMYSIIDKVRLEAVHNHETFYPQFSADHIVSACLVGIAELKCASNHPRAAEYDYLYKQHSFLIAPYNDFVESVENAEADIETLTVDEQGKLVTDKYWEMAIETMEETDLSVPQNIHDLAVCKEMLASIRFQCNENENAIKLLKEAIELREDILDNKPENEILFRQWINSRLLLMEVGTKNLKFCKKEFARITQDIQLWQQEHLAGAERTKEAIRWHRRVLYTLQHLTADTDS